MKLKQYFWITLLVVVFNPPYQNTLAETNIRLPIEDPTGKALSKFYSNLSYTLTKTYSDEGLNTTRILHYGDSHVSADILTAELRNQFQTNFGDGGAGFILAGKPWTWYSRKNVANSLTKGWQINGLSQSELLNDGNLGLAGISFSTRDANQTTTLTATGKYFDIYLMKQPGGGTIEVLLDGEKYRRRISLESDIYEATYVKVLAETNSKHTININTIRAGEVRVLGVDVRQDGGGVIYDALGINGARASRPSLWNWDILTSNLAYSQPDLIVIAYGSNEVTDADLDLTQYQKDFSKLLQNFQNAAPQASLLVISPPDRAIETNGRWQTCNAMPALVEAQRQAALENGAAFWDLFHAMGGTGSIHKWTREPIQLAQNDHVHLTKAGYQLVAQTLYSELAKGYFSYLQNNYSNQKAFQHWPCFNIF